MKKSLIEARKLLKRIKAYERSKQGAIGFITTDGKNISYRIQILKELGEQLVKENTLVCSLSAFKLHLEKLIKFYRIDSEYLADLDKSDELREKFYNEEL